VTAAAPLATRRDVLRSAAGLALAAAVSLGLARFSYALLLPAMRADLGWSYFTAGAMNTVNAAGYLLGALLAPRMLARFDARQLMLAGGALAATLLAAHGAVRSDALLYALRLGTGVGSAMSFIAGGLLAARLAGMQDTSAGARPVPPGLVLGLYYGGTGLGIMLSAQLARPSAAGEPLHWPAAWLALAAACAVATAVTAASTRVLRAPPLRSAPRAVVAWGPFGFALAGYGLFGLGYIGYMTFIITLLREQGLTAPQLTAFYTVLGAGVVASSWLWAGLLQRFRGGQALALLNALLAVATLLPVLSTHLVAVFMSGALFGAVFLSVVAATTALVRHNLPAAQWPGGIAAFTILFAAGQIAGPALVGAIADGPGGLLRGLALSAVALAAGAALAALQRPLAR
jgi:predicted MFS family arabinose efflux permease